MAVGGQELFQCTGPMCRYAEDLAPMLKVMAGPGIKRLKLDTKVHLKDLKFYWMEHDGGSFLMSKVEQDLILAQKKVVVHLETILGASVQHVKLKKMKYSFQLWIAMMSAKGHDGKEPVKFVDLLGDHGKHVNPLWELIKWCLGLSVYTIPSIGVFNALGLPVTQCPLGLNVKGLPLGIQVVAGPFHDHLTLAVAQYLEKTFGGWVCPGKF
ncbi:fatty-acid amide hydrolase 2 isoform X2 [Papio anubis]|uniref:fatty-acid amide hydrolase 2 isoform X2 n=1 Tax=Papio anubis TaxID=9555 RepID=UPI0012ADBE2A|nr:fatty-acid amide hydrolase 2 isoform X2 [Papio anubis]